MSIGCHGDQLTSTDIRNSLDVTYWKFKKHYKRFFDIDCGLAGVSVESGYR